MGSSIGNSVLAWIFFRKFKYRKTT